MRTVANGLITQTLINNSLVETAIPYIRLVFEDSTDYSQDGTTDRLLSLKVELEGNAQSGQAEIILNNSDRTVADMTGQYINIGLGYNSEYVVYPRMWVVSQVLTSAPGVLSEKLILWDVWNFLTITPIDHVGVAPEFSITYNRDTTLLSLMTSYFAACSVTLTDTSNSDGLVSTFQPWIEANKPAYESYQGFLFRLISLSGKYYRMRASNACGLVFPQDADAVDETYYTVTTTGYITALWHGEQVNQNIPNRVITYCNQSDDGTWGSMVTGSAVDTAPFDPLGKTYITEYLQLRKVANTQEYADKLAAARLMKHKSQTRSASFECRFDPRVELYDKPQVIDTRGY